MEVGQIRIVFFRVRDKWARGSKCALKNNFVVAKISSLLSCYREQIVMSNRTFFVSDSQNRGERKREKEIPSPQDIGQNLPFGVRKHRRGGETYEIFSSKGDRLK